MGSRIRAMMALRAAWTVADCRRGVRTVGAEGVGVSTWNQFATCDVQGLATARTIRDCVVLQPDCHCRALARRVEDWLPRRCPEQP